jgi:protein gp37
MGEITAISWTNHTWNPWIGCTKVSPGCTNCYAEIQNQRYRWTTGWGPGKERHITSGSNWNEPLRWAKKARTGGRREKVFCASLADVFDHEAPVFARRSLWQIIRSTSDILDWQLVTKRPHRIEHVMHEDGLEHDFFLNNRAWLITSTEDQEWFDKRVPALLKISAAVHGISAEPLLGAIDARRYLRPTPCSVCNGSVSIPVPGENGGKPCPACLVSKSGQGYTNSLDWVIVGGESQSGARPMHPDWARSLRDQCLAFGVSLFFKQWGEWIEVGTGTSHPILDVGRQPPPIDSKNRIISLDGHVPECDKDMRVESKYRWVTHIGTKTSGSTLDGQEWKQFPKVA